MTTQDTPTPEIKLPPLPEWSKMDNLAGLVPSEIRQCMNEHARAAVELNQQRGEPVKMPNDEELIAFGGEEQFFLFCSYDEFLDIAKAVLRRYSSDRPAKVRCNHCGWHGADADLVRDVAADEPEDGAADVCPQCKRIGDLQDIGLPAASAEPVGPVRLRAEGSEIYLDGVQCQYSIEQGKPWPYSDTLAYVFDPGIAERIVAALNSAPVAQEPVEPTMPPLTEAMRAVLRNEREVYESEDALYAALCDAAQAQSSGNPGELDALTRLPHAVFSRYDQPAASAEPVGPVRLRDEGSEIYLDGVECQYSIERSDQPWPHSETLAYVFDPGIAERIVDALNADHVAQEPADSTLPYEQALAELIDKIVPGLDTGDILADAKQASAALAAQAQPNPDLSTAPVGNPMDNPMTDRRQVGLVRVFSAWIKD